MEDIVQCMVIPSMQMAPLRPGGHWQDEIPSASTHVPPFWQPIVLQSMAVKTKMTVLENYLVATSGQGYQTEVID